MTADDNAMRARDGEGQLQRRKRRIGGGPLVAVLLLLLPVGYVLSIGPTARLANDGKMSLSSWVTIYRPIIRIAGVWKPAHAAMEWYVDLWGVSFRHLLILYALPK